MPLLHLKKHRDSAFEIVGLLTKHRQLIWEMTKREFLDRHAGQVFGILWAVAHPIILMGIYLTVFLVIYPSKFGTHTHFSKDAATYMLSGMIPWMVFQESLNKSVVVITDNANLVKQIIFPLEVLPVKGVLASLLTQLVASFILIFYSALRYHALPWTYGLLPILVLFQTLAMIGMSFILSIAGCYIRDIKELVQIFCAMGMFVTPIFFLPPLKIHWVLQVIFHLNPVSYMVWCYQDVFYYGAFKHPHAWFIFLIGSLVFFSTGYRVFKKFRTLLGNVL